MGPPRSASVFPNRPPASTSENSRRAGPLAPDREHVDHQIVTLRRLRDGGIDRGERRITSARVVIGSSGPPRVGHGDRSQPGSVETLKLGDGQFAAPVAFDHESASDSAKVSAAASACSLAADRRWRPATLVVLIQRP